jgi:WD40 repeat protein
VARVFISYASVDLARAREVYRWLIEGGHEVFFDQDPHAGIVVGEQWRQRLYERLRWADAVVCMVTSAAVVSSWCAAEIATAQAWGSRLLPLRVEPAVEHPLLADIQHTRYIDLTRDLVAARAVLIAALRRIDAAGGWGWPDDRSPFPGLRPFEVDQHRVFFGRADEIKTLVEQVRSAAGGTVLLVAGPSGCGKSSLVRAGLVPVMAAEPGWRVLSPILPGVDPVTALAWELAASARRIGLSWTLDHVARRLAADGLIPLAEELLSADPDGPQRCLLVVVDQLEELLTQTPPGQRARFASVLSSALTGLVRVVGTLRPEFLDQLLSDPDLAALPTRLYPLRPLRREALRTVIERPAQLAGIDMEASLVDQLVEDTGSGNALPLLAFTLAQLAEGIGRGHRLSAARYDQLGGVQGALICQADAALATAVQVGGRSHAEVIAGLLRLVTVDEEGRPTRWRIRRDQLPAAVVSELDVFVTQRLLTTETDDEGPVVIGVAHEAFLSAWPPLAEEISKNVPALRARRAIEHAAADWDDHGRPLTQLWGGGQLAAAITDTEARYRPAVASTPGRRGPASWLHRRPRALVIGRVDLSCAARDFLRASIRRDRARRRRSTVILATLLILALVATGVAAFAQQRAQERQRIATAGQLVGDAEAARSTDLRAALLLGLAAYQLHPSRETYFSLANTLAAGPYLDTLTGHTGAVMSVAFALDGRTLATGSADNTVILWDLTDPGRPRKLGASLTGHTGAVTSVAFAPDGRTLATGSADNTVILWDLTDPSRPHRLGSPLIGHTGSVTSMALTPDGQTLITGSADSTVILWDLTVRALPQRLGPPLSGHTSAVNAVALAPDGHTLVTGDQNGNLILWEVADRALPRPLGSPRSATSSVDAMAFAPSGRMFVTSNRTNDTVLWDLTDPTQLRQLGPPLTVEPPLTSTASLVFAVAFFPDGRTLATSGSSGATVLWDLTDPAQAHPLGPPLTGHNSSVNVVRFAPDGHTLATGSTDGMVILWDLASPVQPQRLGPPMAGHSDWVMSVAFAPDGRTLATGSTDKSVILWDVTDPAQPRRRVPPLSGHSNRVFAVAFSPDGQTLATGGQDQTVILWDVTDPLRPRPRGPALTGHTGPVNDVVFSPDGHTLATGSTDRSTILWDVTNPAQPARRGAPLTGHTGSVLSVAFAPDGRTLATGSVDATVMLWDITTLFQPRQLGASLTGHVGHVNSVTFSPDGHTLATGSDDQNVILWDVADRAQPHRLGPPLTSNNLGVWSVAFAPDGRTLATGGTDSTIILWDVADRTQPHRLGPPLTSNNSNVFAVAFAPDGRTLATGNYDGTATLWDLTSFTRLRDHVVERACTVTRGGLEREGWDRYIPGLPYRNSCPEGKTRGG